MIGYIRKMFKKTSDDNIIYKVETEVEKKSRREIFEEKFFRNLELVEDFKLTYEYYCDITDSWASPAFSDSKVTNYQYYQTLKQISDEEYSEAQCEAIKTVDIHENAIEDFIKSLDIQYANLKLLCDDMKKKEVAFLDSL